MFAGAMQVKVCVCYRGMQVKVCVCYRAMQVKTSTLNIYVNLV